MYLWRIIDAKLATLEEIERYWDINDMADAHEYLDIKAEAERHSYKAAERKAKKK